MKLQRELRTVIGATLALIVAAPVAAQSHSAGYDHVRKVQANRNNRLYISVAGNFTLDHGCGQRWWAGSEFEFDHPQTQAMLQISLSSLLSRKPVHVYTSGCDGNDYPILSTIQIQEREPAGEPTGTGGSGSDSGTTPPECRNCERPPELP
ncbi:MAG: hypothetical protein ACR2RL_03295 [Gammaproteobacteria bacterium]